VLAVLCDGRFNSFPGIVEVHGETPLW
jgi:hypothetical protein